MQGSSWGVQRGVARQPSALGRHVAAVFLSCHMLNLCRTPQFNPCLNHFPLTGKATGDVEVAGQNGAAGSQSSSLPFVPVRVWSDERLRGMQAYACLQARPTIGAMLSASTALCTSDAPPPQSTHTYQQLPHFLWRHQLIQSNSIQSCRSA